MILSAYFDSGVISKWYVLEATSTAAKRLRTRFPPPATLTHLHRVELTTAWQLKLFRGEAEASGIARALERLRGDVDAGLWIAPTYDLGAVFRAAERIAGHHAASTGTRTLDILHVAAAIELGEKNFVTGDKRQAALARDLGLLVTGG